ncbi:MAG TPA: NUDIX hydrolase N-terminal domain-containing protein [Gaiella sp.]
MRWTRALQALAQTGLTYAEGPFDRERYEAVQRIAAEMAASAGGEEPDELLARFAEESGYRTPKVDVRAVVLDAGRLLLVREPGSRGWCLPGGWADVGETPSRAVEKEVAEEAGLTVRAARLLGVFDRDFRGRLRWPAHVYKLYVLCEPLDGTPAPDGLETEAAEYFPVHALPELSLKTPPEQLERALAVAVDPTLPAALD